MRQRNLLIVGVAALAATVLVGVAGVAIGLANSSRAWPGGMMGGLFTAGPGNVGMDRAVSVAQGVAASYPGGGLAVDEVIEFSDGYYASIREKSTGIGAFEILIDPATGHATREPGPDMMWNTRYGMMTGGVTGGGMMGGRTFARAGAMQVSSQQAQNTAQRWLDANQPGSTARSPDPFYGYYTVDFEKGGKLAGMLSVNGYSGAVWYHSWHGSFVQVRDLGA
jgi:hypothetical protein